MFTIKGLKINPSSLHFVLGPLHTGYARPSVTVNAKMVRLHWSGQYQLMLRTTGLDHAILGLMWPNHRKNDTTTSYLKK